MWHVTKKPADRISSRFFYNQGKNRATENRAPVCPWAYGFAKPNRERSLTVDSKIGEGTHHMYFYLAPFLLEA